MPVIYIDAKPYEVAEGDNLLHACLKLGFDVPYFCWHPALHSVGACRLCAVKQYRDEKDSRGRIVMSCMTPVAEGQRISLDDPEVKKFRAGMMELLMLNHPHDCPVCDEGGECHLQDMTLMTGHVYRNYRFGKRTYRNQYIGPFLNHEMNRCIHCYRCLRFYRDYAGGRDLEAFASHRQVYFGRQADGPLENPFSGNLAEVCPTGVFTDKTFKRHFTRVWDLQTAPSLCVHCGLGCNTIPAERYGLLRRIRNRYHRSVNGYFLCDRGRFGYEFVNHPRRIRQPILRKGNIPAGQDGYRQIKDAVASSLASILRPGARLMGVGSPRASLETNYALRTLVGADRFYSGMPAQESEQIAEGIRILNTGPVPPASVQQAEQADVVLVLGEDLMNTAPRLALALRQAVRNRPLEDRATARGIPYWDDTICRVAVQQEKGPLFIATPFPTALDELAAVAWRAAPDELARLAFAVAHALNASAPPVPDLNDETAALALSIADVLRNAKRPLVVSGASCDSMALIQAAANVAWALSALGLPVALSFTVPECNSVGLGLMGARSLDEAFAVAAAERADAIIILENDLHRRAEEDQVRAFLNSAANVIVLDSCHNRTTEYAHLLLPAGTFAESTGVLVNGEGRAQRFLKVFVPEEGIAESIQWLREMLTITGQPQGEAWETVQDVTAALADEFAVFAPLRKMPPLPEYRVAGQKMPRQSPRYSGRTAIRADKSIHETAPPDDPDSPLSFSMEGYGGIPPAPLVSSYRTPGWNSVQALVKYRSGAGGRYGEGDTGERLFEPRPQQEPSFFTAIPAACCPGNEELLFLSCHHIFGSEELSALAPGVAELAPGPYVVLNAQDAARFGLSQGDDVNVALNGKSYVVSLQVEPCLPRGTAGLPRGIAPFTGITFPCRGNISRREAAP